MFFIAIKFESFGGLD